MLFALTTWQRANALAATPLVNLLGYLTPLAALALLWLFGLAGSVELGWLAVSAGLFAGGNLLAAGGGTWLRRWVVWAVGR